MVGLRGTAFWAWIEIMEDLGEGKTNRDDETDGFTPKYVRIVQCLRDEIGERFRPGQYLPSERALQKRFSVTQGTIRRAFEVLVDEGLVETLPYKGTVVLDRGALSRDAIGSNSIAVSVPGDDNRTVALVMPMEPYLIALVVPAVEQELRLFGYRLQVCGTRSIDLMRQDPDMCAEYENEVLSSLLDQDLAGVVWWSAYAPLNAPVAQMLVDRNVPVVLLDNAIPTLPCDVVGSDDVRCGHVAAKHLVGLGHRHLTVWSYEPSGAIGSVYLERLTGFVDELVSSYVLPARVSSELMSARPGMSCIELRKNVSDELRDVISFEDLNSVDDLLSRDPKPTGAFVCSDHLVYSLMEALDARGTRVPEDFAIVSVGDIDRISVRPSHLTTVRQPFHEMGQRAVRLLLQRLSDPSRMPVHLQLPVTLIVRDTCGGRIASERSAGPRDGQYRSTRTVAASRRVPKVLTARR